MTVVPVGCDDEGNIDLADLSAKAEEHANDLAIRFFLFTAFATLLESLIKFLN